MHLLLTIIFVKWEQISHFFIENKISIFFPIKISFWINNRTYFIYARFTSTFQLNIFCLIWNIFSCSAHSNPISHYYFSDETDRRIQNRSNMSHAQGNFGFCFLFSVLYLHFSNLRMNFRIESNVLSLKFFFSNLHKILTETKFKKEKFETNHYPALKEQSNFRQQFWWSHDIFARIF